MPAPALKRTFTTLTDTFPCAYLNRHTSVENCVKRQGSGEANAYCSGGTCDQGKIASTAAKNIAHGAKPATPVAPVAPAAPAPEAPAAPASTNRLGHPCSECGSLSRHRKSCSKYMLKAKKNRPAAVPTATRAPVDPSQLTDDELAACVSEAKSRIERYLNEVGARVAKLRTAFGENGDKNG